MDPTIVTPVAAARSRGGSAARAEGQQQQEPHYYNVEVHETSTTEIMFINS